MFSVVSTCSPLPQRGLQPHTVEHIMVPTLPQQRGPGQWLALAHLEFVRLLVGLAKVPTRLCMCIAGANASLRRTVGATF